jgi:hypothetical protein
MPTSHLLSGTLHFFQAVLKSIFEQLQPVLLLSEHALVQVNQVQEALRRGVVVPALALEELVACLQ